METLRRPKRYPTLSKALDQNTYKELLDDPNLGPHFLTFLDKHLAVTGWPGYYLGHQTGLSFSVVVKKTEEGQLKLQPIGSLAEEGVYALFRKPKDTSREPLVELYQPNSYL